jgi:DNA replication protein DnaD
MFRCIEDNILWRTNEPYCKRAAWQDLILLANHDDNDFILGNQKMVVRRGQHWTSIKKLEQRWGWSEKKVKSFLQLLETENMIYLETTNRGSMITLVNYGKFQDFNPRKGEPITEPITEPMEGQKTEQKKNDRRTNDGTDGGANDVQTKMNKNDIKNDIKNELKNTKKPAAQRDIFVEE